MTFSPVNCQCRPVPACWLPAGAADVVPANALRNDQGEPILDDQGNYILAD